MHASGHIVYSVALSTRAQQLQETSLFHGSSAAPARVDCCIAVAAQAREPAPPTAMQQLRATPMAEWDPPQVLEWCEADLPARWASDVSGHLEDIELDGEELVPLITKTLATRSRLARGRATAHTSVTPPPRRR